MRFRPGEIARSFSSVLRFPFSAEISPRECWRIGHNGGKTREPLSFPLNNYVDRTYEAYRIYRLCHEPNRVRFPVGLSADWRVAQRTNTEANGRDNSARARARRHGLRRGRVKM